MFNKILIVTHRGVIYAIHRILGLKVRAIENLEMITLNFWYILEK